MSGLIEWIIFLLLSTVAVVTAAGMIITMSMYRAGLALMASFIALAGLFVLLDADLLAVIQIMMNVGGMLVMMLFMVMLMIDPGGEMMWDMKRKMRLPGPAAFSMSMPRQPPPEAPPEQPLAHPTSDWTCPMHPEVSSPGPGECPICGMDLVPAAENPDPTPQDGAMDEHVGMNMTGSGLSPRAHYEMMVGMAMSTAQLPWALVIGAVFALLLTILVIWTPWPLAGIQPAQDATTMVGELLLSRYMIAFEGAAVLILAGIVGAVIFAKREAALAQAEAASPPLAATTMYTCPMHPEIRQNGPGECPICGMDLVPEQAPQVNQPQAGRTNPPHDHKEVTMHADQPQTESTVYTCPMHPEVRQNQPGRCPKCGMHLVPAQDEPTTAETGGHTHGGHQ